MNKFELIFDDYINGNIKSANERLKKLSQKERAEYVRYYQENINNTEKALKIALNIIEGL
jgi:uncharacterized membrane protein